MKKIKKLLVCAFAGLMLTSCSDWLDVNENPNTPAQQAVSVSTLLPWVQYHLGYASGAHGFRSQFICGIFTQTSRVTRDGCSAMWEATNSMTTTPYQQFFVGAGPNIEDMYKKAVANEAWHYAAAADITKALGFLLMADMYGEMPYHEANAASAHPAYDTGEEIYKCCLEKIDEAIEFFGRTQKIGQPALSIGDTWCNGDIDKWVKFAYLLKARTLNQLSKKSKYYDAQLILDCLAKAQQSINDDVYVAHADIRESNKDFISGDPLQTNFLWNQTYNSGRHRTMPTKWFTDLLTNFNGKGIEDPRADKILAWREFSNNGKPEWRRGVGVDMQTEIRLENNGLAEFTQRDNGGWKPSKPERAADSVYVGIYAGSVGVYATENVVYDRSTPGWHPSSGNVYLRPDSYFYWGSFAEACFIKAEVLMRMGNKGEAFNAYVNGVKANIDQINKMLEVWPKEANDVFKGCPSFGPIDDAKVTAFMDGVIKDNANFGMEQIMTQKMIALLYSPINWNDMRRHDYKDYQNWNIAKEYYSNSAALRAIPQGKQWRRIKQCSHEINYNMDQLKAIQPNFGDDDIWTYPCWWDIAE